MKRRMNAGRNRARVGMAWLRQDASFLAYWTEAEKKFQQFLAKHMQEMYDAVNIALPLLEKAAPEAGLTLSLGLNQNPLFSTGLRPGELAMIGGSVGSRVPAFMAPRDNRHRLSLDDRTKYDELCATNVYVPPERKENRYGAPDWPEGTELVDGRHPDAGKWGKLCYRTACQAPNAFYWNIGSRKHYCQECADIINREGMGGERLLFLSEKEGEHV